MSRRNRIVASLAFVALALGVLASSASPASEPVLGSRDFAAPYGAGFGSVQPQVISNGGVPSGMMEEISWRHWGEATAFGRGLGHQYKPRGGYYRKRVKVRLKAERLGTCPGSKRPAYTRLRAKFQKRPGGGWGPWFLWSGADSLCEPLFRPAL